MLTILTKFKGKPPSMIIKNTRQGIRKGLHTVADILMTEFDKQVLATPKHGRLYRLKGRLHRASAKYETPANLTGAYRKGKGYKVSGYDELVFGNRDRKAAWLEDGTRKMAPRYGLKNTINSIKPNRIGGILESEIAKALK